MYLDVEDRAQIVDCIVKSRKDLKALPGIKLLKGQYKQALKENGKELHDDIIQQYVGACKGVIAEAIGHTTGLSASGIIYVLDELGLDNFLAYLGGGRFKRLK